MTAAVLGLAWAAIIVGNVARHRPMARRLHTLAPPRPRPPISARRRVVLGVVAAGAGAVVFGPFASAAVAMVVLVVSRAWPTLERRRADRRRLARFEAELPEVVDLLVLAVGAGLNVQLALDAVSRRGAGDLAKELGAVIDATSRGHRLADALDALPERCGDAVRPLVAALVATERYGAPLTAGLERLAGEVRAARRRRADVAARQVSVKLLFPLVVCILPAFALLTVAPLIASALRSLRL